jgi:hypothetical protein
MSLWKFSSVLILDESGGLDLDQGWRTFKDQRAIFSKEMFNDNEAIDVPSNNFDLVIKIIGKITKRNNISSKLFIYHQKYILHYNYSNKRFSYTYNSN